MDFDLTFKICFKSSWAAAAVEAKRGGYVDRGQSAHSRPEEQRQVGACKLPSRRCAKLGKPRAGTHAAYKGLPHRGVRQTDSSKERQRESSLASVSCSTARSSQCVCVALEQKPVGGAPLQQMAFRQFIEPHAPSASIVYNLECSECMVIVSCVFCHACVQSNISVELWDVSGDRAFEGAWPAIMHGGVGIIYVYDAANVGEEKDLEKW